MSATLNTQVVGINDAIRSLNKIQPGLRKEFNAQLTKIAKPALDEAKRRYAFFGWGTSRVTGVSRAWAGPAVRGRKVFPWSNSKADRGLTVKLDADRRTTSTILIQQGDAGTAILEAAGRKTANRLGAALGPIAPGRTRVIGPAVYSKASEISGEIEEAAKAVVKRVNRELK